MRDTTDIKALKYSKAQCFLYRNKIGRLFLKMLISPVVSKTVGAFMNSPFSKFMIKGFVKKNNIDLSLFENKKYNSYNDFFTRKIKPQSRPLNDEQNALISPADSRLSVYKIDKDLRFKIKNSYYNLADFLDDDTLADEFLGGILLIFRLCVDDYHRYCFIDNGEILSHKFIKGKLHTVQPIALEKDNFFKENCREITVMNTEIFGKVIMAEIGAMMVGKIKNHKDKGEFKRAEEKGYFEFGGSTVCVILKKNSAEIDSEILDNTEKGLETRVLFREKIGKKKNLQSCY